MWRFNLDHVARPDRWRDMFGRDHRRKRETTPLSEIASLIRRKNAGPFVLTFDIMLPDQTPYDRVLRSGALSAAAFAGLFRCPVERVRFFECRNALAFKFSIPARSRRGDLGDGDMHGGQQFAPLMSVAIP